MDTKDSLSLTDYFYQASLLIYVESISSRYPGFEFLLLVLYNWKLLYGECLMKVYNHLVKIKYFGQFYIVTSKLHM
jgi:hypothetical protein